MADRPRLLDLFCGAGGAAMGYHRAGFDVVGVDIKPQPRYPFPFFQGDALTFPLEGFDAIHASPPCQAYTTMNNRHGSRSLPLIAETRARLSGAGVPGVMENVMGALSEMRQPIRLTGEMFGLRVHRARLFESSCLLLVGTPPPRQADPVAIYGKFDGRRLWTRADGSELRACKNMKEAQAAMGIDWMTWDELREAIPPAYTEFIGRQLLRHLGVGSMKANG
jgi:DNA (cytosine-5)-methyltransferase 1